MQFEKFYPKIAVHDHSAETNRPHGTLYEMNFQRNKNIGGRRSEEKKLINITSTYE